MFLDFGIPVTALHASLTQRYLLSVSSPSPAERGRRLEQHIAAYFSAHGYTAQSNQILTGRSGGRHEIDVLADKSDALTSYRAAIECKAWNHPIEKDVVSKLHYVMTDLGIHKGVIVSLAGIRSGAKTAAAELGIDLWGPDELRHHLGESVFADVAGSAAPPRGSGQFAYGWPFQAEVGVAERLMRAEGKGRLGLRTVEPVTWLAPMWVAAYLLRMTIAQPRMKRLRQQLTSIGVDGIYDSLDGGFVSHPPGPLVELQLGDTAAIKPILREAQLQTVLRKAVDARQKVTSTAAIERHDTNLQRLGLPVPCRSLSIDQATLIYLPVFAGLLQTRTQDRVVAVDGYTGTVDLAISHLLTSHLAHMRSSFGG
jgi:Restriction endonuclease